jgi:molybdopterin-guanine dinucleotide biosynthesis protein B
MIELAIVGAKNSGKTTVLEALVRFLSDSGYRVATLKHTSHHHRFDTPGKDSYRHRAAGAGLTIALSREEIAVFSRPDHLTVGQIQSTTGKHFDIWLIEGDHLSVQPKVLVTRNLDHFPDGWPENIIASIGPERINESTAHFMDQDYEGLGHYIISSLLENKPGTV